MFTVVIKTLSVDRFDTYLKAAGHDIERAIRLYIWNAQVGASFHLPIQAVEVALRNAISSAASGKFGDDWWRNREFTKHFDRERRLDIDMVVSRINSKRLPLMTAQIVAGLSFGFWVGLLQPKYNPPLWSSHLRTAFPHLPKMETRITLFKYAGDVATLRNRISHHEPIFKRDLLTDFSELMKLLAWICPETSAWIRPHCEVPALMRRKP